MGRYIPERNNLVWMDFEPTKGKEIGKYRPALILSSKAYNEQTGLVICSPVSTSVRGHLTEVAITNLDKPCVVAASLVQTLSWHDRKTRFISEAEPDVMQQVLCRLAPLMGVHDILAENTVPV